MARIAIVEDDQYMRGEIKNLLEKYGYETDVLTDFSNTADILLKLHPDLIILDINLPGQSGFEICRRLRQKDGSPILVLTSRDRLQDEINALSLGADDYLTKPCSADRLLIRVQNLLRRIPADKPVKLLNGGCFFIDPLTYAVYIKDKTCLLPPNEGKILAALVQYSPKIVTKAELSHILWNTEEFIDENALQVNLTRLRKTLASLGLEHTIETVRGVGYRLKNQVNL